MIESRDAAYGLDHGRLRELLRYDLASGVLTWRKSGKCAGTILRGHGTYIRVVVAGRPYLAHRLIWFYVKGKWPSREIDHKDGNGLNNAIDNLRECERSENMANARLRSNNSSGTKGVHWHRTNNKWIVQLGKRGAAYIGSFDDLEKAKKAYAIAAKRQYGEFARVA